MKGFDHRSTRLAIIAGGGLLPAEIKRELDRNDADPVLIGIDGEIDEALRPQAHAVLTFGEIGRLFALLSEEKIGHVVFAGGVRKRPDFRRLKMDMTTLREVPKLIRIVMGGDNSVLEKTAAYFAGKGIEVIGAHQAVPGLLAASGKIAGKPAPKAAEETLRLAVGAAKAIGRLDAGQAAVAEDGRVIALEGAEGTDAMVERVRSLRAAGRLSARPRASILAKTMKPGQDMRADLPAIGPDTIDRASDAGLTGIAIEAGRALLLDKQVMIERADHRGLFVIGVTTDGI